MIHEPCDTDREAGVNFLLISAFMRSMTKTWTPQSFCEYVNRRNKYWSAENRVLFHEVPLQDVEVGVRCAVRESRISSIILQGSDSGISELYSLILWTFSIV